MMSLKMATGHLTLILIRGDRYRGRVFFFTSTMLSKMGTCAVLGTPRIVAVQIHTGSNMAQ